MRKTAIVYLMGLLIVVSTGCNQTRNKHDLAPELHININLKGDFQLLKQHNTEKGKEFVYQASTDYLIVNYLTNMNDSIAALYADDKVSLIMSLYREQYSPYPGKLSNKKGCPEEFQPVVIKNTGNAAMLYAMKLKANNRLVYGGCTDDSNFYSSVLIFYYCTSEKTLYEIQYFTPVTAPVNNMDEIVRAVSCK